MVPTIVGMSVVIVGLVAWCVYLTVMLFDARNTAADALDKLIDAGYRLSGRVTALESPAYPKYLGTLTGSQIANESVSEDNACNGADTVTPDPWEGPWEDHDKRVREALTQAQTLRTGAINTDPNSSAFFEEMP